MTSTKTKTNPKPKMEMVAVDELHLDPANARLHDARNLATIKASLARFGQQKPIVVNGDGVVIAGNGTLQAARDLGWEKISVMRSSLDGVDATAYAIADNRTAELAAWDFPALGEQVKVLIGEDVPLECLGWLEHEIEPLLQADWEAEKLEPLDDGTPSNADTEATIINVRADELEVINQAFSRYKENTGGSPDIGEALKSICSNWLSDQ